MRLSFLVRFTVVTIMAALISAAILAYVLDSNHLRAVQSDLVADTVGQISSALTPTIPALDYHRKHYATASYAAVASVAKQQTNFQEYVRGVRVYWPDGSALYPAHAPPATKDVQAAIAAQDVWRTRAHPAHHEQLFTVYLPLADPKANEYAAVAAIDFSVDQIASQTAPEHQLVFLATLGAVGLIVASLLTLAYGAQRELNRRARLANLTFMQTMEGVAAIVDKRDPYTAGHSRRVAKYSRKLAESMGLRSSEIDIIERAALLHDLGKVGIPDAVLLKPSRLTEHEREIIRFHPDIAAEILRGVEAMHDILPCIVHHHERMDGTGYPRRLSADAIPLGARIIAVADAYDAMTTDRPYRRALSIDVAKTRLREAAGTQFDASCVARFIELVDCAEVVPPTPATDLDRLAQSFGPQVYPASK
jgi:putative nucleotidyltransferase with HDIG domain